jgi:outer membrane immunogenic protein
MDGFSKCPFDVCFAAKSGLSSAIAECPLSAISDQILRRSEVLLSARSGHLDVLLLIIGTAHSLKGIFLLPKWPFQAVFGVAKKSHGIIKNQKCQIAAGLWTATKCILRLDYSVSESMEDSMRKLLVASIAAATLSGASAIAADMPVKAPLPMAAAPFSWNGCYGGVEGGGIWGRTRYVATSVGGLTQFTADPDGGTIGGTLGCNVQSSNWVWGIENDFGWAHISKNKNQDPPVFAAALAGRTSTNWLDTLRGRAGIAVDRSLWYVTGGVAFTDVKGTMTGPGVPTVSITHDRTGWVIGAGVEWALADPRWSFKAKNLYADFGKKE